MAESGMSPDSIPKDWLHDPETCHLALLRHCTHVLLLAGGGFRNCGCEFKWMLRLAVFIIAVSRTISGELREYLREGTVLLEGR